MPSHILAAVQLPGLVPAMIPNNGAVLRNFHLIKTSWSGVLDLKEIHIALGGLVNVERLIDWQHRGRVQYHPIVDALD